MLIVSMLRYVDFHELFVLWVGSSGGWLPPASTPFCGGRGERGIFMPLGEEGGVWEAFGDKL